MADQAIIDKINKIEDAEEQIQDLEGVLQQLEDGPADKDTGEALLKLMERCADDDDFGTFSSIESVIDNLDQRDNLLRASIRRRPMWKTLEMIGGEKEDLEVLEAVLKTDLDESIKEQVQETYNERKEE